MNGIVQGTRVEITSSDGKIVVSYVSEIRDGKIVIEAPKYYNKDVVLDGDTEYQFVFFVDRSLLWCDGVVTKTADTDETKYAITATTDIDQVKRRTYHRFTVMLAFSFYHKSKLCSGVIKDISQGGIRFVSNENITDQKTRFVLELNGTTITIAGEILAQLKFPRSNYQYQYRVKFYDLQEEHTSAIKKFIFDSKLKQLAEPTI